MRSVRSPLRHSLVAFLCALILVVGSCDRDEDAGVLLEVLSSEARLNGDPVAGGDRIPFSAVLSTDQSGVVEFILAAGQLACRLYQGGEIRVGESADSPVAFVLGDFLCNAEAIDQDRPRLEAGGKIVEVSQAEVNIEVTEERVVVRNAGGVVIVDDVPLEDGEEMPIDRGTGLMGPSVPFAPDALPPDAPEVFEALGNQVDSSSGSEPDDHDTPTPDPKGSPPNPTEPLEDPTEPLEDPTEPPEDPTEPLEDPTGSPEEGTDQAEQQAQSKEALEDP